MADQILENVEGQPPFRVRHCPGRRRAQFIAIVSHELQQVVAERGSGHFAQHAAKHFPQGTFGVLCVREQQLGTLSATLDESTLQWQRWHAQSSLAHPTQDLLRRLWTGRPPQAAQRRQPNFQIAVTQAFGQRGDAFRRASLSQGYERPHAPPAGVFPSLKNPFLDEPAFPQKLQQSRGFFHPCRFERIQRNGLDNPAVERILAPRLVRNPSGNQQVPILAQFEDACVALREMPFSVHSPDQDKSQEQSVRGDGHDDGLQHKCRRP